MNANIRICRISTSTCTCNHTNIGTNTCIHANIGTNIRSTLVLVDSLLEGDEYSTDIKINIRSCTNMHVVRYTAQNMKSQCPRMDLVIWMRRRAGGVAKSCKEPVFSC